MMGSWRCDGGTGRGSSRRDINFFAVTVVTRRPGRPVRRPPRAHGSASGAASRTSKRDEAQRGHEIPRPSECATFISREKAIAGRPDRGKPAEWSVRRATHRKFFGPRARAVRGGGVAHATCKRAAVKVRSCSRISG